MPNKTIGYALKTFDERYFLHRLSAETVDNFAGSLKAYLDKVHKAISDKSNEEAVKNLLNRFLIKNFYSNPEFDINAENRIDSVIKYNDNILALIEAKRTSNTNEMVRENDINKKAFWEIVFYYLCETRDTSSIKVKRFKNAEIKRLIISDGLKWILIDAIDLEKICDGYLEKHFYKYKNNQLIYANDNQKFYDDIKNYFEKINVNEKLDYVYFDMETIKENRKEQGYLYKIFKPDFLLKFGYKSQIKTHVLNEKFYQELLYIMGLKEIKDKNSIVIKIDPTIENSLADQVYKKYHYDKERSEAEAEERTFELIIIWINRLLFIKLFEGQLIAFNCDNKDYHILDNEKIKDFSQLQDLFFNVLGKKNRSNSSFYNYFKQIPYLNSSLFERQQIEKNDININVLKNAPILKKGKSVLGKATSSSLPLLEYIIDFLNSYSFSAQITDTEGNIGSSREIIDAAVLGLIFEKLNAYKDGSHYTPSTITEYMARETLEIIILKKINSELGWNCNTLLEAKENIGYSIENAQKINAIINKLKICDPAVGSGHFLVSALNQLIAIKKELNVLFKHNSNERLVEYDILVENDVLRIIDGQYNDFVYEKTNALSQKVQETIFNEKKMLIEECLFGVDLNVNAVSICNLRLWIELLKNAYYSNGVMETLPNIDINIKCGNSLISRLEAVSGKKLNTKSNKLKKDEKHSIKEYKELVKRYKSASEKDEKNAIRDKIKEIKGLLHYSSKSLFEEAQFEEAFEWAIEFPEILNEEGVFLGFDCIIGNPPYIPLQNIEKASNNLAKKDYQTYSRRGDIYCLFYERGYALLNEQGVLSFVTSNKWMRSDYGKHLRKFLANKTNPLILIDFAGHKLFANATVDVNILMFEKGKNKKQTRSCLMGNKSFENLYSYIRENNILNTFNAEDSWTILSPIEQRIKKKITEKGVPLSEWDIQINYGVKTGFNKAFIIDKAKRDELIAEDPKSAEIIRPILRGRDIKRYTYEFADLWLIDTHNGIKELDIPAIDINNYPAIKRYLDEFFRKLQARTDKGDTPYNLRSCVYMDDFSKQKIVYPVITKFMNFCYDKEGHFTNDKCFILTGSYIFFLVAFFNSSLFKYCFRENFPELLGESRELRKVFMERIPVIKITDFLEQEYETIIKKITAMKLENSNTKEFELQIDKMIFDLYELTEEEQQIIGYIEIR